MWDAGNAMQALRTWGSRIGISQRWGTLLWLPMSPNDPRFFNGSLVVEILPNLTVHGTGMSKGDVFVSIAL